jgi:D-alanyl-D-alanine carboxypeptidase
MVGGKPLLRARRPGLTALTFRAMRPQPRILLNTASVEVWPAWLLRARSNGDARALARASQVLRRKRDGRFLAAVLPGNAPAGKRLLPLLPRLAHERGIDAALLALEHAPRHSRYGVVRTRELPLDRLHERLETLGLDDAYAARSGLPLVAEPEWLALAGFDRYRRPLWLQSGAAVAWQRLHAGALRDGVVLEAISGYRSHDYQLGIFERKQARGQSVEQILAVNAAPGYSEHHSGRALDIGAPGEPPAEEGFEATPAFAWLRDNADAYGFAMSYPRDNPHGIVYEPWHWCWHDR